MVLSDPKAYVQGPISWPFGHVFVP